MKKGFTLIELLIVIAIIGILASIVLPSLNSGREKGNIASVKSDFSTVRTQATLYYNEAQTFGSPTAKTACPIAGSVFEDETVNAAITAAQTAGQGTAQCAIGPNGQTYAVSVQFKGPDNLNYYCVDSASRTRESATDPAIGGDTDPAACP